MNLEKYIKEIKANKVYFALIKDNNIGHDDAVRLADSLMTNTNIIELSFCRISIGKEISKIAQSLYTRLS